MDYKLGNAAFVLLVVIGTEPKVNGYAIRRIVEERGMVAWAGVGSSSIYNGLKKAEQDGLLVGGPDSKEEGRGPRGRAYELTQFGSSALKGAIVEALSGASEVDQRFNIGLSGISVIGREEAARCLRVRSDVLTAEYDRLEQVRAHQQPLPISALLLFDRILNAIASERDWTLGAVTQLA